MRSYVGLPSDESTSLLLKGWCATRCVAGWRGSVQSAGSAGAAQGDVMARAASTAGYPAGTVWRSHATRGPDVLEGAL